MELVNIFLTVFLLGLSGYGVGNLLVNYEGPFDICKGFRRLVGISYEIEEGINDGDADLRDGLNPLGKMFTCTVCASVALSALFSIPVVLEYEVIPYLIALSPAAASGVAVKLNE